jgi:hypothetical protein
MNSECKPTTGNLDKYFTAFMMRLLILLFYESLQRILTTAIERLRKASEFKEKIYSELIGVVIGQAEKIMGLKSNQCS